MSKSHIQHDLMKKVFKLTLYNDESVELVNRIWKSQEKGFRRGLKQAVYGFPSNNRRKLHGKPMYRWRWMECRTR